MPYESEKQRKFMKAIENDPEFAKKVKVPQRVAKEFAAKDKRKKK